MTATQINAATRQRAAGSDTLQVSDAMVRLIESRIRGSKGRVLISFAGCGSECIVAEELGVEWMGIEINPEYVNFAEKSLELTFDG
ncbi:MAG: hypothetical protein V6Z81_06210 [Parvularculales bacterium]